MSYSMPRALARPLSSICHQTKPFPAASRGFVTHHPLNQLRPESPNYIEVPKPPQPSYPEGSQIKGVLPVPRNVLLNRNKKDKTSKEFLESTIREPSLTKPNPVTERAQWQQRMSATRRLNLRQGIEALKTRDNRIRRTVALRSQRKQLEHKRLAEQSEPEDVQLTSASVSKALRDFMDGGATPQPPSQQLVQQRRNNVEQKEQLRSQRRKEALQDLYVQARSFIVTPKQLNDAIDDAFGSDKSPIYAGGAGGPNPWASGTPESIKDMLERNQSNERNTTQLTTRRIKTIAEELTGGKIQSRSI